MENFIKVEDLTFEYRREGGVPTKALDGISFVVERGSFTAVIGQNGSGKSTLARTLNGLLVPTGGRVLIDGLDTADDSLVWDIRRKIAMVFQNPDNQLVSAVVEDDVAFGPENVGIDPAEIRQRVDDALRRVDMYEFREKGPHHLSGGQKQRVAIAGAVAMHPECIVFDEPTAMLDPRGRREVLEIIRDLNSRGMTVVLITHFMEEAAKADQVIVLDGGRIRLKGIPKEIYRRRDELEELGLGVPAAVELAHELRKRGIEVPEDITEEEDLVEHLCR